MLDIKGLCYRYPGSGSDEPMDMQFDLKANAGELLSVIGPSGSGKSTLLHLVAGFLQADGGSIRLDGCDLVDLPPAQRSLTMVFQHNNLFPHLDLYTNVALGLDASLKLSSQKKQVVADSLQQMGLAGLEYRKPGQLSGGQRQRVALARALVRRQPLLLLDEPFAALGPALRRELIEVVLNMVQQRGMTALLVSHDPRDALLASPHTAFIEQGKVHQYGPTQTLLDSDDERVQHYLGPIDDR